MTWRPIKDFENYEISDEGQVRSLPHVTIQRGGLHPYKGRLLKPKTDKGGYLRVMITDNVGKKHFRPIHRLVAQAFLPNPDNLPQVNHKNENKTDNRVENLEWCTVEYNINYGTRNKRTSDNLTNHPMKSKPVAQLTLNGELVRVWDSTHEAGRNGFNQDSVCKCCNNIPHYNTHKGYKWRYINQ